MTGFARPTSYTLLSAFYIQDSKRVRASFQSWKSGRLHVRAHPSPPLSGASCVSRPHSFRLWGQSLNWLLSLCGSVPSALSEKGQRATGGRCAAPFRADHRITWERYGMRWSRVQPATLNRGSEDKQTRWRRFRSPGAAAWVLAEAGARQVHLQGTLPPPKEPQRHSRICSSWPHHPRNHTAGFQETVLPLSTLSSPLFPFLFIPSSSKPPLLLLSFRILFQII